MNKQLLIIISLILLLLSTTKLNADSHDGRKNQMIIGFYEPSISFANRADVEISLNFWAQELIAQQKSVKSADAKLFSDIKEMQEAFERGELDLIIAPPLEIVRYFKRENLADGFKTVRTNNKPDALIVLIRSDKKINGIEDLQGKRLLMPKNDNLADVFLETLILQAFKKSYHQVFSNIELQAKNNHIILDLFFNKADVALVYQSAYDLMLELNPQLAVNTKIMTSFPLSSRNFSYFRRDFPYRKELTEFTLNLHSPRFQQILEVFQSQTVNYCKLSELEQFDKLNQKYMHLKKGLPKK